MNILPTSQSESTKVGLDYFLYSCFEYETTIRSLPKKILGETRWPMALTLSEDLDSADVHNRSFLELVGEIIQWYSVKFPYIKSSSGIDLAILPEIVPAMVMMASDFSLAAKSKKLEHEILFDKEKSDNGELWESINKAIVAEFPNKARFIQRYLQWAFAIERVVEIDLGSRPPVGKYASLCRHSGRSRESGNRAPSQDNNGNERHNYNQSSENRPSRHGGGGGRGKEPYGRGNNNGPFRDGNSKFSKQRRDKDPQIEKEALREVQVALDKLSDDDQVNEIKLPPMNSYYRRIQHKKIVDAGFYSLSRGEGPERAVVVMRAAPAGGGEESVD